ncbi:Asp-tRNA(Asn)/Glu-tRNA(Gln) amidotransferase subunit GatC [Alloiococcus sp. CFN-8]|uniref:Asp-tRNA(Asn)/Glu-tRNA(Gln) amidotransferase subunit GatC n=1 Tax=Alloiococcus sp. CFN-8 TaxID=3416081 RepID=UPI003CFA94DD
MDNLADLAKVYLTDKEKEILEKELPDIIEFFHELSSLDIENVKATAHVIPLKNILREDQVMNNFSREELLQNAPTKDKDYIIVPKVVD